MMKYKRFNIWTVMILLEEAQATGKEVRQLFKRGDKTFSSIGVTHTVDDSFEVTRGSKLLGVFKNKGAVWSMLSRSC